MKPNSEHALTPFQKACVDDLLSLAAAQSATVYRNEPVGQKETYVVLDLTAASGMSVKAWIYSDECMLTAGDRSFYFETPDFRIAAGLRDAFTAVASDLLQGKEPRPEGSSRINLFRGEPL